MIITIGDKTRECMKILGIEEFPFPAEELKTKFRVLIKQTHPDMSKSGGNEATRQLIEAYNHLKNLIQENIPTKAVPAMEEDGDIFDLTKQCGQCNGKKVIVQRIWVRSRGQCSVCKGTGREELKCKFCNHGKFKTKKGSIVPCRVCKGTGVWKTKPCRCGGSLGTLFGIPIFSIGHYKEQIVTCPKCNGKGKVKVNPFNPMIPRGAVLTPK